MTTRKMRREVLGDNLTRLVAMDGAGGEQEEINGHDAALEHVRDCSDEEAQALQDALDRRAGARDRRARDDERKSREQAFAEARDGETDHRRDFASAASGGADDNPAARRRFPAGG